MTFSHDRAATFFQELAMKHNKSYCQEKKFTSQQGF